MKTMAFPTLALVVLASVRPAVPALAREPGVPWAPAGQLPRAVSQVLDDPQWAALKKASATMPGQALCSSSPARFKVRFSAQFIV